MVSTVEMTGIKLGYSPKEMGYLESRASNKAAICSMYQLPVELFNGGDHATYNNMDIFVKKALIDAVLPEYEKKKDGLSSWLAKSYDPSGRTVIDYDLDYFPELQKNKEELMKWMNEGNCFTPNERRVAVGYEPKSIQEEPNADKITVSSSIKLLDDMDVTSFDNTDPELI
jgi:phage portal protein BeeE